MEPTFFKTPGSSHRGSRQQTRRIYQTAAALIVLALMGVALWAVLRVDRDPAGSGGQLLVGQEEALKTAAEKAGGDATGPSNPDGGTPGSSSQPPKLNLTSEELATEGHIPAAPAAADSASEDVKTRLQEKYAQAEAALARKDPLQARALFNEVVDRGLPEAVNAKCVEHLANLADETLLKTPVHIPNDPLSALFQVPPNGALWAIAKTYKVQPDLLKQINNITDARRLQANQTIKVVRGPFNAVVDKSDFTLSVYLDVPGEGDKPPTPVLVRRYKVGLGEYDSTPVGVWRVLKMELDKPWRNPRTNELVPVNDPKYPLGKPGRWIGLEGIAGKALGQTGYGIHGTNERDSIGKQASLGCVRMLDEHVADVWKMLRISDSRVTIRD